MTSETKIKAVKAPKAEKAFSDEDYSKLNQIIEGLLNIEIAAKKLPKTRATTALKKHLRTAIEMADFQKQKQGF